MCADYLAHWHGPSLQRRSLLRDEIILYVQGQGRVDSVREIIQGLESDAAKAALGSDWETLRDEVELIAGGGHSFDPDAFLEGTQTPVYFGTALGNFGIREMLDGLVAHAPAPQGRPSEDRPVKPEESAFSGFVFKIQANMDPKHRDRIAFLRVCSGRYGHNMKMRHVRPGKDVRIADAVTFSRGSGTGGGGVAWRHHRAPRHHQGDTFSEGEALRFTGIPNFAPELFRRVRPRDPLRSKQLEKGLKQLAEEGAMQVFRPLDRNELVVGAVGVLQFDVVAYRLQDEYKADCLYDSTNVVTARWVESDDPVAFENFKRRAGDQLALDGGDHLTFLATSRANLSLMMERFPEVRFRATREH